MIHLFVQSGPVDDVLGAFFLTGMGATALAASVCRRVTTPAATSTIPVGILSAFCLPRSFTVLSSAAPPFPGVQFLDLSREWICAQRFAVKIYRAAYCISELAVKGIAIMSASTSGAGSAAGLLCAAHRQVIAEARRKSTPGREKRTGKNRANRIMAYIPFVEECG